MYAVKLGNAPGYSIDSPHVRTGYRSKMTFLQCWWSMFRWHNQTLNIWTSILLVAFNLWATRSAVVDRPDMPPRFQAMFWFHGGLRAFCWVNSWVYHTFVPVSERVARLALLMDYLGCYLTPLGMGSNLLFIVLAHRHDLRIACTCLGAAGVFLSVAASVSLPQYQTEAYRGLRIALSAACTLPYLCGLFGATQGGPPTYYVYFLYAVMCEILAGWYYLTMFPESRYPRTFDYLMSSHTIWHWLNLGFDIYMLRFACMAYDDTFSSSPNE